MLEKIKVTLLSLLMVCIIGLGSLAWADESYVMKDFTKDLNIPEVMAKVNDVEIRSRFIKFEFNRVMKAMKAVPDDREKKKIILSIISKEITRELIFQEGQSQKVEVSSETIDEEYKKLQSGYPDAEAFNKILKARNITSEDLRHTIRMDITSRELIRKVLKGKVNIKDSDVRTFFENNRKKYYRPESFRVQHIFLPHISYEVAISTPSEQLEQKKQETSKTAEQEINKIYEKVKAGENFAELAKKYSQDVGSASKGGDMDFMYKGVLDPSFDEAVDKLKLEETSGVVMTSFGYHIIKLKEKRPGEFPKFEEIESVVQRQLYDAEAKKLLAGFIDEIRSKSKIEVLFE